MTIDDPSAIDRITRDLSEIGTVGVEAEKSIICLVGQDLWKDTVFLSRVFKSLHEVPVRMISLGASDINLSLVVPEAATEESVRSLHAEFFA
jgi:aspartate kinase